MAYPEDEPSDPTTVPSIPAIAALMTVSTRAHAFLSEILREEMEFDTSLVMGERTVEIPGRYNPLEAPSRHAELIVLRKICDYATALCKHECAVLKLSRHVRHAHEVWRDGTIIQRALMLSRAGKCGIDTAKTTSIDVEAVASIDRPASCSKMDLGESIMYSAATLQRRHGLPYDYESSASLDPPTICPVGNAALCDPLHPEPLHTRFCT